MTAVTVGARPLFGRRKTRNPLVIGLLRHALLIGVLIVMLYPVVWMVAASFRPSAEVMNSLGLFSKNYTLDNYKHGWTAGQLDFSRYFLNSVAITGLSIVGNLLSCSLTAYAFARLEFPLKRILFGVLLATMLLPYHVTLVPQYILFNELAWMNTYLPLVVPKWLGVEAFFIFLMVQFIRTLPRELDDAARIDGCGHWRTFSRIIMPLALPALGTTALFTFINSWNDFLGPLLYLNRPELWTVSLGLNSFLDVTGESAYGSLFAMSTLALAPIVGFFLVAQKLLIEGVATTGLK